MGVEIRFRSSDSVSRREQALRPGGSAVMRLSLALSTRRRASWATLGMAVR